jgi:hypothetical protein
MIDVRQAAQSASNFIVSLYAGQSLSDVRLEEVEVSDDDKYWLITLSFLAQSPGYGVLNLPVLKRQYKILKVDRQTGDVLSMKIRELANEAA